MKTIQLLKEWRSVVDEIERRGEPVALELDGQVCGVLLRRDEAQRVATRYAGVVPSHAQAAPTSDRTVTYLDLLQADPTLVPQIDGRPLHLVSMMNSSYVDPQQLRQFEDAPTSGSRRSDARSRRWSLWWKRCVSSPRSAAMAEQGKRPLFDPAIVRGAVIESFKKLNPRHQVRNPVMFVVLVGAILTTVLWIQALLTQGETDASFIFAIGVWLWFTVLFANFAEAMAEGRGKAQADTLRNVRRDVSAKKLREPRYGASYFSESAAALRRGDANQTALALERARLADEAEQSRVEIETERLLSSVSHDLRTPLATITGATGSLLHADGRLDDATRRDLIVSINDEADRLNRLVRNLLDMTRLEAGAVDVQREWQPLEEVVGAALTRLDDRLAERSLHMCRPICPWCRSTAC